MKTKQALRSVLIGSVLMLGVAVFTDASAQVRKRLDRIEDRRDSREDIRDRREDVRDRREDRRDRLEDVYGGQSGRASQCLRQALSLS